MTMTNTTRRTDETLLAHCRSVTAPSEYTGWKHDHVALIDVLLPDGTRGYCYAWQILSAAVCDTQEVKVRQGMRCDLWFPSQLRLGCPRG